MSAKIRPRTMSGALELLPLEQIAFTQIIDNARTIFEKYGFLPIETPVMEYLDVLLTKSGGDTEKQIYLAQSSGSRDQGEEPDLGLRYDLTVPLARYVAEHEHQLTFPFRRYQIQKVYRGERPQKGRYREFYQCDLDVVGKETLDFRYDAEVPAAMIEVYRSLGVGGFKVNLSHRKLLLGLLESLEISAQLAPAVLRELDKIDKRGSEAVAETLSEAPIKLSREAIDRVLEFVNHSGPSPQVLDYLGGLSVGPMFDEGCHEIELVTRTLGQLGARDDEYVINLAITRGLDYYTGSVYEVILDDYPELGSVGGGGRYENLAGLYTKSQLPGVGMSFGATRLFSRLRELPPFANTPTTTEVLVTQLDRGLEENAIRMTRRLREVGLRVELVLEEWKFKKQMKYADQIGVPFAVIQGPEEAESGSCVLKDMTSGDQRVIPEAELASTLSTILRERGRG